MLGSLCEALPALLVPGSSQLELVSFSSRAQCALFLHGYLTQAL
jgi:hypothetical protein